MEESKVPLIYSAICGVMEDVGVVEKNDLNSQQGFKYRSIDAVMNALNPAMIKHKIFCAPEVLERTREERKTARGGPLLYSICRVRYRFFATDGSYIDTTVIGEGMDSGDKATSKAMAAAFKYACFQLFCIPTENMLDDPDSTTPEPSTKKKKEISDVMLKALCDEMERTGMTMESMLRWAGVDELDEISAEKYKKAMDSMKERASVPGKIPPNYQQPMIPENQDNTPFK